MFLSGRSWYTRNGQHAAGSFLMLFMEPPPPGKLLGRGIGCLVRYCRMTQSGHFMGGSIVVKSDRAKAVNDPGVPSWYSAAQAEYYRPYVRDGSYRIYVEGAYGNNGLTMDIEHYPGLWEQLHPLPEELVEMKRNDTTGWNSAGSEGPSIREWATSRIKELRQLRTPE